MRTNQTTNSPHKLSKLNQYLKNVEHKLEATQ
jgi:hypothetical protein